MAVKPPVGTRASWLARASVIAAVAVVAAIVLQLVVTTPPQSSAQSSQQRSDHPLLPRGVLSELMRAARRGDVEMTRTALRTIKAKAPSDINQLDANKLGAIHHALQGRHVQMLGSVAAGGLRGQHELVAALVIASPAFDAALRCPLYYAVQFRNMAVIALLLQRITPDEWHACVAMVDLHNETLLFAAARSSASGFARLFVNAAARITDVAVRPDYMRLLDVRLPVATATHSAFSFLVMTNAIGHADAIMLIPNASMIAYVHNTSGYNGNTPLHVASAGGRAALVRHWLDLGANASVHNSFGQSPRMLACANGFLDVLRVFDSQSAAGALATDAWGRSCEDYGALHGRQPSAVGSNGGSAPPLQGIDAHTESGAHGHVPPPADSIGETGGWGPEWTLAELARDTLHGPSLTCTIVERDASLSAATFARDFLALKRPVVIRGLGASLAANPALDQKPFLQQFGHLTVQVGPIPYADTYGMVPRIDRLTISEFVAQSHRNASAPSYIFDAQVLWQEPTLRELLPVPPIFEKYPVVLAQFMLGPRGSGAPPHFHGHAVNVLVYGAKRWTLFPPSEAFFTARHVLDWLHEDGAADVRREGTKECVQLPGDAIFVPEFWGHAVVNIRESMAVAYEFHE